MTSIRLFAFPFAGGSAMYYYKWRKLLDPNIDFVPVELAGRGTRRNEPLKRSFSELLQDAFSQVEPQLDEKPYAFFGHSMGCLLSYELTCRIREAGLRQPERLILSGRWAPHVLRPDLVNLDSSEEELKARLLELGGATEELFDNEQLASIFLPILRADFEAMESYRYEQVAPLAMPIDVLTGAKDVDVNKRDLAEWRRYTEGPFSLHKFKGGHFYMNDSTEAVVSHINRTMRDQLQFV